MNYLRLTHHKIEPIFNHPEFNRDNILWESIKNTLPKYFKNVYLPTSGNLWFLLNLVKLKNIAPSSLVISDFSEQINETFIQLKKNHIIVQDNILSIISNYEPFISRISEKKLDSMLESDPEFFTSWFIALTHVSHAKTVTFCWNRPTMLHISESINKTTKGKKDKNLIQFDSKNFLLFNKILDHSLCVKPIYSINTAINGDFAFYDLTCITPKNRMNSLRWYYKAFDYTDKICQDLFTLNKVRCKVLLLTNTATPKEITETLKDLNFHETTLESNVEFFITKRRTGNKSEMFQIWKNY